MQADDMVAAFGNTYGWSVHDMAAVGTATELNAPQPPRRVIVVDDDPDFLQGLRNLLIVEGYEVARAANADQALERIERFDAQLAIIDYRLGRTAGVDLVRPLQQRRPDLHRPFRTWGYPVTPLLFLGVSLWMMYWSMRGRPVESMLALLTVAAGGALFAWTTRRESKAS